MILGQELNEKIRKSAAEQGIKLYEGVIHQSYKPIALGDHIALDSLSTIREN